MTLHINEIDLQVAEYLTKTPYKVLYVANREHDKEWACDEWLCIFGKESFTFKTGLGHRIQGKGRSSYDYMKFDVKTGKELKKLRSCFNLASNEKICFQINDSNQYAVIPTQANVLYCLLLDSNASDENFKDWADNLGYDSDSLTALNIYQECIKNSKKLNKVFTKDQLNHLQELLQDY